MAERESRRFPLNIFLLKETGREGADAEWSLDELLAKPLTNGKPKRISVDVYPMTSGIGTLYVRKPYTKTRPEWVTYLSPALENPEALEKLVSKSYSAILVVKVDGRQFVLAFGHGRHMIDMAVIEYRFGLRVALNSIAPNRIASIDKQTFDANPKISREQAIKAGEVSSYGINAEQDMLRAIVGITDPEHADFLGGVIAGMDSLKIAVKAEANELQQTLSYALQRAASGDYLKTDGGRASAFAWVDNLSPVSDRSVVAELDKELWRILTQEDRSSVWMAIPEIVDWHDVDGFSYSAPGGNRPEELSQFLDVGDFVSSLRRNATLKTLKGRLIYMWLGSSAHPISFPAYRTIYAEIKRHAETFILNAGNWFKVSRSLEQRVNDFFNTLVAQTSRPNPPFVDYDHIDEADYNAEIPTHDPSYVLLDRKLVQFGGGHSTIELCDLFHSAGAGGNAQLVHVKRGRSSAMLSHLFAQGLVSCELLTGEQNFVSQVDDQLAQAGFTPLGTVIDGRDYDLVYVIVDGPPGSALDIPFFSKVNLESSAKRLQRYGFTVKLMHVTESVSYSAKRAAKKAAKQAPKKTGQKAPRKSSKSVAKKAAKKAPRKVG